MTFSLCRTRNLRDAVLSLANLPLRDTRRTRTWSPDRLPRMRASYGPKSGPNAGSRASSPGEQAAACDCQKIRELGSLRDCQKIVFLFFLFSYAPAVFELEVGGDEAGVEFVGVGVDG